MSFNKKHSKLGELRASAVILLLLFRCGSAALGFG